MRKRAERELRNRSVKGGRSVRCWYCSLIGSLLMVVESLKMSCWGWAVNPTSCSTSWPPAAAPKNTQRCTNPSCLKGLRKTQERHATVPCHLSTQLSSLIKKQKRQHAEHGCVWALSGGAPGQTGLCILDFSWYVRDSAAVVNTVPKCSACCSLLLARAGEAMMRVGRNSVSVRGQCLGT